jgi:serine/threonine protein kinase/CheY-like chemotaxis protein
VGRVKVLVSTLGLRSDRGKRGGTEPILGIRQRETAKDEKHLLATGELLDGRYRLLRHIGCGGYGEVYAVEHAQLKKKFALKVLNRELSRRSQMIDRFRREAMATSKIDHPNIVSLTDFGRLATGQVYYVMELLEGTTLADLLDREKTLGISRAIPILAATCHALAATHRAGFVHRDLKPANIFIAEVEDIQLGSKRDFVKILDFGLAKVVHDHPEDASLSTEGVTFGTPGYMAPEQLQGQEITCCVDIYAIGCLAFEMFAGKPVFTGSPMVMALAHCEKVAPLVRQRNSEARIPERMEFLIDRCLRKEPRERFQSCLELLDELRELTRSMISPDGQTMVGAYDELDGIIDTDKQQWWEDMSITLQLPRGLKPSDEIVLTADQLYGKGVESDELTVRQEPDDILGLAPDNVRQDGATAPDLRLAALELMRLPEADTEEFDFPQPGPKVLLVEPDPTLADTLRVGLREHGCQVEWLADGENILQVVDQQHPELIVLSVELGQINGYTICSQLKQSRALKGIPVVLISTEATEEHFDKHRKLSTRAEAYLRKPFETDQLLSKVDALTGSISRLKDETPEIPAIRQRANPPGTSERFDVVPARVSSRGGIGVVAETVSAMEESEGWRMDRYLVVGLSLATVAVLGFTLYFMLSSGANGAMILQVKPAEATLKVDGKILQDTGGTRIFNELAPGDRTLVVSHPGCKSATQSVRVRSGKVAVAKFKLTCSVKREGAAPGAAER